MKIQHFKVDVNPNWNALRLLKHWASNNCLLFNKLNTGFHLCYALLHLTAGKFLLPLPASGMHTSSACETFLKVGFLIVTAVDQMCYNHHLQSPSDAHKTEKRSIKIWRHWQGFHAALVGFCNCHPTISETADYSIFSFSVSREAVRVNSSVPLQPSL